MGERLPCTEEVRGSNPLISTGGVGVGEWAAGGLAEQWPAATLGSPKKGRDINKHNQKGKTKNKELREVQRLRITWKKLIRAYGGCLGNKSRRRTWYTAKSLGEPCAGANPGISEWGNPRERTSRTTG